MAQIARSVFVIGLFVVFFICAVFTSYSFSQGKDNFEDVSFSMTAATMRFFDHDSGKLYVYSSETGDFLKAWTLVELGEDLEKIRFPKQKESLR